MIRLIPAIMDFVTHHVVAWAMPQVVAFDLATVAQIFGHVDETAYTFEVASAQGGAVGSSTGFALSGLSDRQAFVRADTVVIPGYLTHEAPDAGTIAALIEAAERGTRIVSVCTGAFALAATGLLDGLRATTHWQDAALLQERHPAIDVDPDVLYVDHGHLATSAGVAAGIDLCLHLVRKDLGETEALRIARRMVVAPHRAGGQGQFIDRSTLRTANTTLSTVLEWASAHISEPLSVRDLARRAALSERHFARRFVEEVGITPLQWLIHQRVLEAQRLLEQSRLSLDAVAQQSGFGTAATLRRHFAEAVGVTPSIYRATFSGS